MIAICQYQGKSAVSRMIRLRTWSDISHSAIALLPDSFRALCRADQLDVLAHVPIIEAWRGRVQLAHGIETLHTPGTPVRVYAVEAAGLNEQAAWQFALSQVGAKYDYRGVLGFVSRRDGAQRDHKWFCSEHAFASVLAGGVELLARIPAHRVSPGVLDTSPLMVPVFNASNERRQEPPERTK